MNHTEVLRYRTGGSLFWRQTDTLARTHKLTHALTHAHTHTHERARAHAHARTQTFLPTQTEKVRMKTYPYRIGGSLFQRNLL